MRTYGKVHAQFWSDGKVRQLSSDTKTLFLYLLTSPHSNAIGCFRLPVAYICEDTGMPPALAADCLAALCAEGFADYDETTKTVWVRRWLRYNPPENRNVVVHCRRLLASGVVPERFRKGLDTAFAEVLAAKAETVAEPLINPPQTVTQPMPTIEPEPEPEPETEPERRKTAYAFDGIVIRLTRADLDRLAATYHAIPDMVAELTAIDAKFVEDPPKQKEWFGRLNGWLKAGHEKRLAAAKAPGYRRPEVRANREVV